MQTCVQHANTRVWRRNYALTNAVLICPSSLGSRLNLLVAFGEAIVPERGHRRSGVRNGLAVYSAAAETVRQCRGGAADMTTLATGMALSGKVVFTYSIGKFSHLGDVLSTLQRRVLRRSRREDRGDWGMVCLRHDEFYSSPLDHALRSPPSADGLRTPVKFGHLVCYSVFARTPTLTERSVHNQG